MSYSVKEDCDQFLFLYSSVSIFYVLGFLDYVLLFLLLQCAIEWQALCSVIFFHIRKKKTFCSTG